MDFETYDIGIIPFICAMVALLTSLGLPKRLAPLVSVILGGLIGVFYLFPDHIPQGLFVGVTLGLSSVGLYSGTKNTVQMIQKE